MNRDIVCFVKESDNNEELRYAIRSWEKNLPHRRIVLVGYKPSWLNDKIRHIKVEQKQIEKPEDKYHNTTRLMIAACQNERVSDDFYLANDDMFIMKPVKFIPLHHWGTVGEVIERKEKEGTALDPYYMEMMRMIPPEWKSYAIHVPMPINKNLWLSIYDTYHHLPPFHANRRTIYGRFLNSNLSIKLDKDVKIYDARHYDFDSFTYLSTAPGLLDNNSPVGRYIKNKFKEPSRYEKTSSY